jgi:hypothetical protein
VLNSAIGPADLLSGSFDLSGVGPGFALSGFGSFADLMAGASFDGLERALQRRRRRPFLATLVLQRPAATPAATAAASTTSRSCCAATSPSRPCPSPRPTC